MKQTAWFFLLLSSACLVHAQAVTELAERLSAKEASELLPGAAVAFTSARGNSLSWKNDPDGTMMASSVGQGRGTTRKGTWKVDDKGRFCVSIDWPSNLEEWCRYIVKEGDTYYLTRANGERVSKLSVSR